MTHSPESHLLTIAIPSFDRNELLERAVRSLLPQLCPGVRLVVRDNASPTPAQQSLAAWVAGRDDVEVVRNPGNIGGNANFLRCLETCQTEWLWVLGDDDAPAADAVARILADIRAAPPALLAISYRCELFNRQRPLEVQGMDGLIERMDSLSSLLFLSTNVLRAPALQRQLRMAYAYAYSNMPQIIALMYAAGSEGRVRFSMERIVSWADAEASRTWSVVNAALAFPTLLDLPLSQPQRRLLAAKLEQDVHPALAGLARQLLALACAEGDFAAARWTWRQMRLRRFGGQGLSMRRALAWLLGWLLLAPRLSRPVVETVARLVLRERAAHNTLQDRTRRI
jgi:hypothetical protein